MFQMRNQSFKNQCFKPILAIARPQRHHQPFIFARRRSVRRATDEVDPPRDYFSRSSPTWHSPDSTPLRRDKEPFDAELLILFGLPTIIIIIPWAIKDPAALAVIPVLFLIPGVRDVLLAVLRSLLFGVKRAKKFMKEEDMPRRAAGAWAPPPPPPPPGATWSSPAARGVYDLTEEEFAVESAENGGIGEREELVETAEPSPAAAEEVEERKEKARRRRQRWVSYTTSDDDAESNYPSSRSSWGSASEREEEEEEQEPPPPPPRRKSSRVRSRRIAQYNLEEGLAPVYTRRVVINKEEESDSEDDDEEESVDRELEIMERRRKRRAARAARRQSLLSSINSVSDPTAIRNSSNSSIARRPVVSQRPRRRRVPWYLQPLVAVFPFLKDWGGFLDY